MQLVSGIKCHHWCPNFGCQNADPLRPATLSQRWYHLTSEPSCSQRNDRPLQPMAPKDPCCRRMYEEMGRGDVLQERPPAPGRCHKLRTDLQSWPHSFGEGQSFEVTSSRRCTGRKLQLRQSEVLQGLFRVLPPLLRIAGCSVPREVPMPNRRNYELVEEIPTRLGKRSHHTE